MSDEISQAKRELRHAREERQARAEAFVQRGVQHGRQLRQDERQQQQTEAPQQKARQQRQ
jgi:hypothetical protein